MSSSDSVHATKERGTGEILLTGELGVSPNS